MADRSVRRGPGSLICATVDGRRVCQLTDVARLAKTSRQALQQAVKKGTIQAVRPFGPKSAPLIIEESARAWLQAHKTRKLKAAARVRRTKQPRKR